GQQTIEITSRSQRTTSKNLKPVGKIVEEKGAELKSKPLAVGAVLNVAEDSIIEVGDILAKIPLERSKNTDITGGLP
ncbi:hypothetical protein, partial [Francisella tularensis]|uniref:hypothetical protein n=1 Tax=Francisella tularensis TaxID=263 RepID=UPI0023819724